MTNPNTIYAVVNGGVEYLFKVGDRVLHTPRGWIGHIESIEEDTAPSGHRICDVRWLTPTNKPSACISICWLQDCVPVSSRCVPMPWSAEKHAKAKAFCEFIKSVIKGIEL